MLVNINTSKGNDPCCQHAKFAHRQGTCNNHAMIVHYRQEKIAPMKARGQHIRTGLLRQALVNGDSDLTAARPTAASAATTSTVLKPKRRQVAVVKAQELESMVEVYFGTLQISELQHDEDVAPHIHVVGPQLVTDSDALCNL